MKFVFYNDTGREVSVHSATFDFGVEGESTPIKNLEERVFQIPDDHYVWTKMWDYEKYGLQLLLVAKPVQE